MSPLELEFLAEKETVLIIPNFTQGKLFLICGDCGPFTPSIPIQVPLWLALNLRQRQKCRIIPPEWMDVEKLEQKKQEETDSDVFTRMPSEHYREISELLCSVAISDIPRGDEIHTLIKDISDIRMAKLRSSVDAFMKSGELHAQVNNLTVFEINFVRPLLTATLRQSYKLRQLSAMPSDSQSQSQSGGSMP